MKRLSHYLSGICLLTVVSCDYQMHELELPNEETENTANSFDFSTVSSTNVDISYVTTGLPPTNTYFEVYVDEPVSWTDEGVCVKQEGLNPLYCGYTNADGKFSGHIELPAYATKLYVYSPAFFATTLMSADISDGKASVSDDEMVETEAMTRGANSNFPNNVKGNQTTRAITEDHWNQKLGNWNQKTGQIQYEISNENSNLFISNEKAAEMLAIHSSVIMESKPCPEELRTSKDLTISLSAEDKAEGRTGAEVAITMLGGNSCWSSSLGYYYYKDGEQPTSYQELLDNKRIIMLVPNTQDGTWNSSSFRCKGINRGTNIQLYYYGDNLNEDAQREFPEGIHIGFVLFSHAWSNQTMPCGVGGGTASHKIIASSTPNCNVGKVQYTQGSGCAMFTYDSQYILMSFEDHSNDQNFSDVVFTMSTNPLGAFTDVNIIKESEIVTTMDNGIYCFEDLWPSKGDYDMNDVMVNSKASKTLETKVTTTTIGNSSQTSIEGPYCTAETFEFSIYKNYAALTNGLAFTLEPGTTATATYTMTVDGQATDFVRDGQVFYITSDVKNMLEKKIVVTATYGFNAKVSSNIKSQVKPFIYRRELSKNWEVHVPYEVPTADMNISYFGTGDDKTDLTKGNYFTREGDFPFAFFLSNASQQDVSKLLDTANESKSIDTLYPDWNAWVTSKGQTNADWYKK